MENDVSQIGIAYWSQLHAWNWVKLRIQYKLQKYGHDLK